MRFAKMRRKNFVQVEYLLASAVWKTCPFFEISWSDWQQILLRNSSNTAYFGILFHQSNIEEYKASCASGSDVDDLMIFDLMRGVSLSERRGTVFHFSRYFTRLLLVNTAIAVSICFHEKQRMIRVAKRPVCAMTSWFWLTASCVLRKVPPGRQTFCLYKLLLSFLQRPFAGPNHARRTFRVVTCA